MWRCVLQLRLALLYKGPVWLAVEPALQPPQAHKEGCQMLNRRQRTEERYFPQIEVSDRCLAVPLYRVELGRGMG